jgi:hypothetical protein
MAISTIATLQQAFGSPILYAKNITTNEGGGLLQTAWNFGNEPSAAAAPSGGLPGTTLTAPVTGAFRFTDPTGSNQKYLARMQATMNIGGSILLVDRLWHNSGVVVSTTAEQSINGMSTLPARDVLGSTGGRGLFLGVHVVSTTTNNSAITNMTIRYTNDAGTTGRVAACSSFPATCVQGTVVLFPLQAGDTGVRQVNGITLGTSLSTGAVSVCLWRPIAMLGGQSIANNTGSTDTLWRDAISLGFPRLYNGSVIELWNNVNTAQASFLAGSITYAEG